MLPPPPKGAHYGAAPGDAEAQGWGLVVGKAAPQVHGPCWVLGSSTGALGRRCCAVPICKPSASWGVTFQRHRGHCPLLRPTRPSLGDPQQLETPRLSPRPTLAPGAWGAPCSLQLSGRGPRPPQLLLWKGKTQEGGHGATSVSCGSTLSAWHLAWHLLFRLLPGCF